MAEIPRVPQATPSNTVGQPIHRIAGPGDRPHARKERERRREDILDLHEEQGDETAETAPTEANPDDEGHLDIAV